MMYFINYTFYKGLIIGVFTGITLNVIKNYIFPNTFTICDKKKKYITDGEFRSETNSLTKENGEFKIALLVRHDLKMGKGKVAAQVRNTFR